jgi:alpha-tubulin suppressor-like RCC1 family protein
MVMIAGGGAHSLAVDANGNAWAWGFENTRGQLGNGTRTASGPARVIYPDGKAHTIVSIAAGKDHSLDRQRGRVISIRSSSRVTDLAKAVEAPGHRFRPFRVRRWNGMGLATLNWRRSLLLERLLYFEEPPPKRRK